MRSDVEEAGFDNCEIEMIGTTGRRRDFHANLAVPPTARHRRGRPRPDRGWLRLHLGDAGEDPRDFRGLIRTATFLDLRAGTAGIFRGRPGFRA